MGLISNGTTFFDAGALSSGIGGSMVLIKKLTASSSATLSFVDGSSGVVLDNTYKEYVFICKNIEPSNTGGPDFTFNMSIDTGSNYNVAKTTTQFNARHSESGTSNFGYVNNNDLGQGTGFQIIADGVGGAGDECADGILHLFNPSSTTFIKHFTSTFVNYRVNDNAYHVFSAGYANTTSAVDAVQFKFSANNIDAGTICLYGIN
tara:strand:+ start:965 stop:1579 length:615 start_codon:yes stop_codon:yes gene_type:complete